MLKIFTIPVPSGLCTTRATAYTRIRMIHVMSRSPVLILLVALSLVLSACTQDPATKKQQHLDRGVKHLDAGRYTEAVIELKTARSIDPGFVPALHALGRAYYAKAWYLDARRELQRAIDLHPSSTPPRTPTGRGRRPRRASRAGR